MTKQNLNGGAGNQVAATAMVFENPEFGKIRTLTDAKGEPLFCGKDVCEVLGYKNPSDAVRQHVEEDDLAKCEVWVATGKKADGTVAQKRMQMLFINESGFYGLMFGSQQQAAKRFTHWVTAEVLPLIRKNGCYMLRKQLKKKDMLIGKQAINILALRCDVKRLTPKANYADNVLNSISCYTTTQIAKELGCTAQELNRSLCEMHVQYYQSGQYMLYADLAHEGLAKSRTHFDLGSRSHACSLSLDGSARICTHTYLVWTEKGRKFLHDLYGAC